MKNGFIYPAINNLLQQLEKLNLVEYFKKTGKWLNPEKNSVEKEKTYERVARDIFIILKWAFVIIVWHYGISNFWVTLIVWYLIVTNLYTYFMHHIWCDDALINTGSFDKHRARGRFLNLMLAAAYSDFCFAYLYRLPYHDNFNWPGISHAINALWFSISNSLAANYDVVKPITDLGNSIAMIQLIMTFIFVTIIISRSIPQTNSIT